MISFFRKPKPSAEIFFYNTLGKEKQQFKPLRDRYVKMYTCGPTVYDYVHIGNFRTYLFSEMVRRVLEYAGYEVKQIMNITDFGHLVGDGDEGEDKMTAGLKREGLPLTLESMHTLGTRYMDAFIEDMKRLNMELPFTFPRASEHIGDQRAYVEVILNKGYAYKTADGVYFDTGRLEEYGALGGVSASDEHSRIGVVSEKKDAKDFALWKFDEKGWDAPWGKGFPGWHIECVAMSTRHLGKTFDIHTGGIDLIPVHHNNEIAEAEAANRRPLAHYWMHGAFLAVEGKRIGKSEGNAIRLYQLEERGIPALAYRYLCLTVHYRQTMNFTWEAAEAAKTARERALRFFADIASGPSAKVSGHIHPGYREKFTRALYDDLNMPEAISVMWALIKDESVPPQDKRETLLDFDRVLGIGFLPLLYRSGAVEHVSVVTLDDVPADVEALVAEREAARKAGLWERADELRTSLKESGYAVEDTKGGPVLRRL